MFAVCLAIEICTTDCKDKEKQFPVTYASN